MVVCACFFSDQRKASFHQGPRTGPTKGLEPQVECPLVANGKNACSKAGINLPEDVCFREYYVYILNRPLLLKPSAYICILEKVTAKRVMFPLHKVA